MDPNFHPLFSGDTSDPLFSNFSLQSLLTSSFFSDETTPLPNLPETITHSNNNFLVPKTEHPLNHLPPLDQFLPIQQPFNFFPQYELPPPPPFDSFHHLPQLTEATPPPPPKQQQQQPHSVRGKSTPLISKLARQRRQKLSEKTRCLQKLMPWDKKMGLATLLEQASKYVKFLQAQYSVLQSMPSHDSTTNNNYGGGGNGGRASGGFFGDLEMLNRNQALQVMVNSPVAQTKLCSQGYCVFSMEQFSLLRKLSERRQLQQKNLSLLSHHGFSKRFFH